MPTANRSPGAGDQLSSTSWRPRIFQRAVSITHPEQRVHGSAPRTGECRRGIAIYGLSAPEVSAIYSSVVCSQRLSFAHSLPFAFLCFTSQSYPCASTFRSFLPVWRCASCKYRSSIQKLEASILQRHGKIKLHRHAQARRLQEEKAAFIAHLSARVSLHSSHVSTSATLSAHKTL